MPTPESAAFLAKKPTVPPTFIGVDFSDHNAVNKARDAIIREQWVQSMMARLVRDELGKCYMREGVNHLANCGKYRDRYIQLLKENRAKGYRGQQQNYDPNEINTLINNAEVMDKYKDRAIAILAAYKEHHGRDPAPLVGLPDIMTNYPTVQQAKGAAGSDHRKGYTLGNGKGGLERR